MKTELTLEQMLERIGSPTIEYGVIMQFGPFGQLARKRELDVSQSGEIIYSFDDIAREISRYIYPLFYDLTISNNYQTLFMEILYNAIGHGNRFNPDLYVTVDVYSGNNGVVISIQDEGKGFDVEQVRVNGEYERGGLGFKWLEHLRDSVDWNYENSGSRCNLMFLKGTG